MIRFKNKMGFMSIEALVAIAIVSFIMTPLIVMQASALESVVKMSHSLHRIFLAKSFLYQARRQQKEEQQQFSFKAEELDPVTELAYELAPVKKGSALHDIPGLLVEKVESRGLSGSRRVTDTLVTFVYRPVPEPKQETP
jgi:hypothetical protein